MGVETAVISTGLKVGLGVLGKAASVAYGTVAKTGKALGNLSSALTSASQDLAKQNSKNKQSTSNVIIGNFGIAGTAGKQKIAGQGNLPAPKNVSKPQVSEKMPTEALMDTAVKYLSSIDKSLKAQLEFEKRSYEQQARDQREAIIEDKKSFNFSDIKNRLSGFKSSTQDAASTLGTVAKYAAGLGIAASLVASSLDTKQLEELKTNVEEFKKKFEWLSEIPAGGIGGFLIGLLFGRGLKGRLMGGLKGGLVGILTSAVADVVMARMSGGEISGDTKSILNLGTAGALGYLGYRGIKSASRLSMNSTDFVGNKFLGAKGGLDLAKNAGTTFREAGTGKRVGSTAAFFASPKWRKFLAWLSKKGRGTLVKKIETRIAIAVGSAAVASTGIGAAVGVLGILINVFGSLYLAYEIYQLWKSFTSEEEATNVGAGDAELAKEFNQPDATRVGGAMPSTGIVSKSETGKPEEAQAFFESKGWTKEQAAGIVGNLFVESGLKTDAVGDGGRAYGIAQWHPDRQARFQQVYGKSIKESNFKEQLEFINWELNNSEKRAGSMLRNAMTAEDAAAIVDQYYERSSGAARGQRIANASSIVSGNYSNLQGGGGGGGSLGQMVAGAATASLEQVGKLFGTLGSAVIKPGVERRFAPSGSNASDRINTQSMQLQNDITLGIKKNKTKDLITSPTMPATSPGITKPTKSISSMDPNYQNLDVLTKYLAHFRMAA